MPGPGKQSCGEVGWLWAASARGTVPSPAGGHGAHGSSSPLQRACSPEAPTRSQVPQLAGTIPQHLPCQGVTYLVGISEPPLPRIADPPEAGGPCLLQKVPDVVRSWAQPFLLQEESGEGEDGAEKHCLRSSAPANVHRGQMKPSSYLAFASLHYLLELEMRQLTKLGALLCSDPARGQCFPLQRRARALLSAVPGLEHGAEPMLGRLWLRSRVKRGG